MILYTHVSRAGGARYVYELLRHLGPQRGDVTLVCPDDFQFRKDLESRAGIRVQPLLRSSVHAEGKRLRLLFGLLRKAFAGACLVLKTGRSERLVHANFPGLIFSAMPTFLLWRIAGKKIIFTVHDVIPHRWLLPRYARKLESAIFWISYHAASHLIVHHPEAKFQLQRRFHVRPEKISIIPHGTFCLDADPLPLPPANAERIALAFGSIRENKGINLAIQAVQQLRSEGHSIALRICGPSSRSESLYWETCKRMIASAPDGIEVRDSYIADSDVRQVISSSHFLILPYTEFHSQSGVAALALSNGRPILATRAGGLAEVVIPGKTGIVIAAPRLADVKKALYEALQLSDQELQSMAASCATLFRAKYSWSRIAALHCALYQQLVPEASVAHLGSEAQRVID